MNKEEIKRLIMIGIEIAKNNAKAVLADHGAHIVFNDEMINVQVDESVELEY